MVSNSCKEEIGWMMKEEKYKEYQSRQEVCLEILQVEGGSCKILMRMDWLLQKEEFLFEFHLLQFTNPEILQGFPQRTFHFMLLRGTLFHGWSKSHLIIRHKVSYLNSILGFSLSDSLSFLGKIQVKFQVKLGSVNWEKHLILPLTSYLAFTMMINFAISQLKHKSHFLFNLIKYRMVALPYWLIFLNQIFTF